jgi:hypothetical protein
LCSIFVELQALDELERLTPLGRMLVRLPIDPRVGKMLLLACCFGLGDAAATIAARGNSYYDLFGESLSQVNGMELAQWIWQFKCL